MGEFTPLEQRIQIRNEFYHEATAHAQTDGVMREITALRIDRLLDEYNLLATVQPTDNPTAA